MPATVWPKAVPQAADISSADVADHADKYGEGATGRKSCEGTRFRGIGTADHPDEADVAVRIRRFTIFLPSLFKGRERHS